MYDATVYDVAWTKTLSTGLTSRGGCVTFITHVTPITGAFTGGFSAGYFNTVGSAEGFEPASFKSSRSERVSGAAGASKGARQQSIDDFLDEDELEERKRTHLQVKVWGAVWGG